MKKFLLTSIIAITLAMGAVQNAQAVNGPVQVGGFTVYCQEADGGPWWWDDFQKALPSIQAAIVGLPAREIIDMMPATADFEFLVYPPEGGVARLYTYTIPVTELRPNDYYNDSTTKAAWEEIRVPNTIYEFSGYSGSFRDAVHLHTVSLSASKITKLNDYIFSNCASLQYVSLPETLKEIGVSEFNSCTSLKNINIPASVTKIGEYAFRGCTSLEKIDFPGDSLEIGGECFYGCTNLQEVNFQPNMKLKLNDPRSLSIHDGTRFRTIGIFEDCTSLTSLSLPEGVETIPSTFFFGCTGLKNITLPRSIKTVKYYAFKNCTSLQTVSFPNPDSLAIDLQAFENCTSLASVDFDNSTALKIGDGAFRHCALTSFTFPEGTYDIGRNTPFLGCTNLKTIYYNARNLNFHWSQTSMSPLFGYRDEMPVENVYLGGKVENVPEYLFSYLKIKELTIPKSVTKIETRAFSSCDSLKAITIPETVEEIGDYAFSSCNSLKEANIQGKLTGKFIFYWCKSLEKVIFSETIDTIPDFAFAVADSLKTITIPQSVTHIGNGAFAYLPNLQQVKVNWQTPLDIVKETVGQRVFNYTTYYISHEDYMAGITLVVPRGTKELYKAAPVWQDFKIEEDLTGIDELTMNNEQLTINKVEVFDISGHKIVNGQWVDGQLIEVPFGVYILKMHTDKGIRTQKFIKK